MVERGPPHTSQAHVVLCYSDDQFLRQQTVPGSGTGGWWYVCDLNAVSGSVHSVNRLQDDHPAGISENLAGAVKDGGLEDAD